MPTIPEPEAVRRNTLALSLIQHRKPTERLVELVRLALLGASVADLVDMERGEK